MKASEINPQSWIYGLGKIKTAALMRKWEDIIRNTRHMESSLLTLMSNPATTPEQLSMAAELYVDVTQKLFIQANLIDDYIYNGKTPPTHMLSCPAHKTGNERNFVNVKIGVTNEPSRRSNDSALG